MEECGPQQQKQQQEAVAAAAAAVAAQAARLAAAEEGVRGLQGQVEQQGQGAAAVAEQLQKLEAGVQEARAAAEKATAAAAAPAPGLDPESAARLEALEAALAKEAEARGKVLQEHAQVGSWRGWGVCVIVRVLLRVGLGAQVPESTCGCRTGLAPAYVLLVQSVGPEPPEPQPFARLYLPCFNRTDLGRACHGG